MKITKRDDRWYDENDNSWSTEESATQFSPTLTNCISCRDCRWCNDCSNCIDCSDWTDNKKYEPVTRPFIDCRDRLLEPDL